MTGPDAKSPPARAIWLWRAWAGNRSRICDCGIVWASSESEATSNAWRTLGGPWKCQVIEMQVEHIGVLQ